MTTLQCSDSFLSHPVLPGIEVKSVSALPVTQYNSPFSNPVANHGLFDIEDETFCNVTVSYTHAGSDAEIHIEIWLPWADQWNERLMAVGGGGWAPGRNAEPYHHMAGAVSLGYATLSTDAGLEDPWQPAEWALERPGVTNYVNVANWGTDSLEDLSVIGKNIVEQFYSTPAAYSYFSGCSQGGRQGYELAQKYPDAFDGIAAAAPSIKLPEILMAMFWPHHLAYARGNWPKACELDSLDAIAIELCDGKDGLVDGLISDPELCDSFDPFEYVGTPASTCEASDPPISELAAYILNATWSGIWDETGQIIHPGVRVGTDLTGNRTGGGVVMTTCEGEVCTGIPLPLGPEWIQVFGMKSPNFTYWGMTDEQFLTILRDTSEEFSPYVGSSNPDLSEFKASGGKLLTFHGLADQTIPSDLSRDYYESVKALDAGVKDFFRFFEVPGLSHCIGNGNPTTAFDALRSWVEDGTAPAKLPVTYALDDGSVSDRIVCAYPQKVRYDPTCGDETSEECFHCGCA